MPLSPGDKLGHYEILSLLGKGGMGEVYRAKDTKLKRDVALKVLPDAFARDAERMARFQREAEVLASLNHTNIAAIYGVEDRALVMELVEGASPKGPLPFDEAWKIVSQIVAALEYAHDKGIVHRDLKPANIKITPEGIVKLLDFGLAKAFTNQGEARTLATESPENSPTLTIGATNVGVILGTAAYMPPEQAKGKTVDKRADVWSFGVVLYELLTGERLFQGEDAAETLAAVIHKSPDLTRTPEKARRLLQACLEKDPKLRLRDIGDARRLLGEDPPAQPPPTPLHKSWLPWCIAAFLVLALMPANIIHFREASPVALPLIRFDVDLGPEAVAGSRTNAILSPDGTRMVFLMRGSGGVTQLATRTLDQAKATPMPGTQFAYDPFFSPDGQWVGFFSPAKLKKVAVQGGAPMILCDAGGGRGGSWGEDGNIIFAPATASGLLRIPAVGGTPEPVTKLAEDEGSHRWPQVLPGGKTLLFTANTRTQSYENAYLEVLSLTTGQMKIVQSGGYFGRYVPSQEGGGRLLYVHEGTLFAVPFDLDRLETRGTPSPILNDIAGDPVEGGGQFDLSQNGSLVYESGKAVANSYPIVWMDSAGKTTPLLAKPSTYGALRFSPEGQRLAFTAPGGKGTDVWVYDWRRETPIQLTFTGPGNLELAWTPDGKHIVFGSSVGNASSLWWIRSDGSGEPQKLLEQKNAGVGLRPQSFTPDGRRLVFDAPMDNGGVDLYTLQLDLKDPDHPKAGKPEPFLISPAREVDSAFSPDGHWMAYASNEAGGDDLFVRAFPGPGGKWRISDGGGKFPTWSRDGRQLFFLGSEDRIMVTDYTANGDSFSPGKPRVWSDQQIRRSGFIRPLDLHPDGKRFAVFERPATENTNGNLHVTFLLNFTDELRRRAPAAK